MGRILVVDDEAAIQGLLCEYLGSLDHEVRGAHDGVEALEHLGREAFDLVISDINMPRMKGFELLRAVREKYPNTKRALITAYNVEDYLMLALEHDVGNIIAKTTPFCFDELERVVRDLLTGNFFGLEHHLERKAVIQSERVTAPNQIDKLGLRIAQETGTKPLYNKIRLSVVELATNALFYGARGADGARKESWDKNFVLPDKDAIVVSWGRDQNRFGISIADPYGRLEKKTVLYWLARQATHDAAGLPLGVFDSHGRGLFITRSNVDRLLINIETNRRTEIVALLYTDQAPKGSKPLYINEI